MAWAPHHKYSAINGFYGSAAVQGLQLPNVGNNKNQLAVIGSFWGKWWEVWTSNLSESLSESSALSLIFWFEACKLQVTSFTDESARDDSKVWKLETFKTSHHFGDIKKHSSNTPVKNSFPLHIFFGWFCFGCSDLEGDLTSNDVASQNSLQVWNLQHLFQRSCKEAAFGFT